MNLFIVSSIELPASNRLLRIMENELSGHNVFVYVNNALYKIYLRLKWDSYIKPEDRQLPLKQRNELSEEAFLKLTGDELRTSVGEKGLYDINIVEEVMSNASAEYSVKLLSSEKDVEQYMQILGLMDEADLLQILQDIKFEDSEFSISEVLMAAALPFLVELSEIGVFDDE